MAEDALVAELEQRLSDHTDFEIPVVVRTLDEMASVVERCPFDSTVDPTSLVVYFAPSQPENPLGKLDPDGYGHEQVAMLGRELYLLLPEGQGRSKLAQAVARTPMGSLATARNYRTVAKLLDMARQTDSEAGSSDAH